MKPDLARDKAIEKLVAGRLRAQLRPQGPDCPEAETLAAYVEQTLPPAERLKWETHLAACSPCQEHVAALVRLNEAEEPALDLATPTVPARRLNVFRWTWAAPALVAVLVAGLWYTGEFHPLPRQSQETAARKAPEAPRPVAVPSQSLGDAEGPMAAAARRQSGPARPTVMPPAKIAPRIEPAAPKASAPAREFAGSAAGLAGVAASTGRSVGVTRGVIATPSERARLAVGGATAGLASEATAGAPATAPAPVPAEASDSRVKEDRVTARADVPPPLSVEGAEAENERAEETKSAAVAKDEAQNKMATKAEADAVRAAPRGLSSSGGRPSPSKLAPGAPSAPPGVALKAMPPSKPGPWRVGRRGLIQKSDSTGNWVMQASGVETDLFDISSPGPAVAWAVGQAGTILRTDDGGTTWKKIPSPTTEDLLGVTARDEWVARVVTRNGRTLTTTNGGKTWSASGQD